MKTAKIQKIKKGNLPTLYLICISRSTLFEKKEPVKDDVERIGFMMERLA